MTTPTVLQAIITEWTGLNAQPAGADEPRDGVDFHDAQSDRVRRVRASYPALAALLDDAVRQAIAPKPVMRGERP